MKTFILTVTEEELELLERAVQQVRVHATNSDDYFVAVNKLKAMSDLLFNVHYHTEGSK